MSTYDEMTNAEKISDWREANPEERLTSSALLGILDGPNLRDTDLTGADLTDADLRYTDLRGAGLSHADLGRANLRYTDLRGAGLSHADLADANLRSASLRGANLRYADLTGANLRRANLWGANLSDADWNGLQITGLPSGQIVLTPTSGGWELRVGCWTGTIDGLRTLIAQDEGWPEAEGYEITRRRPGLQAALNLIEAHIALYPTLIGELKEQWSAK